jgi:hypothetical protein
VTGAPCWCGRPIPTGSRCGRCCAEHDHPPEPLTAPAGNRAPIGFHAIRAAFEAHIADTHGDPRTVDYSACPTCSSYLPAEWAALKSPPPASPQPAPTSQPPPATP